MSIAKAERLMDLVIALLNSPRYRTAQWVQSHVAGYDDAPSDDAFSRMFERDKQELRDMGIPIETEGDGYLIRPGQFALPAISFTAAESAALAVASRLWETTALKEVAPAALRKLRDAADDAEDSASGVEDATGPVQVRVRTAEAAFPAMLAALRSRRAVRFEYRAAGAAEITQRTLHPWGMTNLRGVWYVAGWDVDRDAVRTFRLSRIVGGVIPVGRADAVEVPGDFDIAAAVRGAEADGAETPALLRIRPGTADGLRRRGVLLAEAGPDGYDEVRVEMDSLTDVARRVAAHGPDVIAVDPPELQEAVIDILAGVR